MAGSGYEYLGSRKQANRIIDGRVKAIVDCPLVSAEIAVLAATGLKYGVTVPSGAFVYRVGLFGKTAVSGGAADLDLGDGDDATLYGEKISAVTVNQLHVGSNLLSGAGKAIGKYYASGDTIDLTINATGAAGTVKVCVWYDLIDPTDDQVLH